MLCVPLKISDLNWERNVLYITHRMPNTDFGFIHENKTDYVTIRESTVKHQPSHKPRCIDTYINKSLTCQISLADVNCFLRYFYYMSKHHFLYFSSTECKDLKKTNQVYFRFPKEKQTHLSWLLPCCFTMFTISYFQITPTFIPIYRRNIYLTNIPVKCL